jgi:hypothetical protein
VIVNPCAPLCADISTKVMAQHAFLGASGTIRDLHAPVRDRHPVAELADMLLSSGEDARTGPGA